MTTLTKAQTIDNKIVALRLQIEKLEAQRQQAAFEDKLLPGAVVSYMSARSANAGQAKIVAISTNDAGRDARYTVRINEDTADETTRQLRLAEITGVITEVPACH
jgi:hypothetical protein